MHSDPVLDPEIMALCTMLTNTFSSSNQEEQKNAEDQLHKLSQTDTLNFLIKLNTIILDKNISETIKLAASNYCHKIIRMISFPNSTQIISADNKVHLCTMLYNTLNTENVSTKVKKNIQDAFGCFLTDDSDNSLKNKLLIKINEHIMSNTPHEILGVLYTICAILRSLNATTQINIFFAQIINPLNSMARNIYLNIIGNITTYAQADQEKNQEKSELALKVLAVNLEILNTWTDSIENFVYKMNDLRDQSLKNVLVNETLANLLGQILFLNIDTPKQIKECIISTTGFQEIDKKINTIKISILQTYRKIINFIFDAPTGLNYNLSQFFHMLHNFLPNLIVTLNKFCNSTILDSDALMENDSVVENLLVECLSFLSKCAGQIEFYKIFSDFKKTLIVEVILSLLTTSDVELETMKRNPEEFVTLALDTCDKQTSETSKTASAQLLEALCDHIDGTLTQTTLLIVTIMRYSIDCNGPSEIPQRYPLLLEFQTCKFIEKKSAERRVEAGLLILTVISYLMPKRLDLLKAIEDFLLENLKFLTTTQSELIRVRLSLFLGYYLDSVLLNKEHQPIFSLYLKFILENLVLINSNPEKAALSYQAIDALNSLFEDDESVIRMSSFINDLFPTIFSLISLIGDQKFLEMIQNIVKYYAKYLMDCEELTSQLVSEIVKKILQEKKALETENKKKKLNISMMRCWNILRTIAENKYFVPKCLLIIENNMTPLFEAMKSGDTAFDDDIICFFTMVVRNIKKLTPKMKEMFIYYSRYFEQKECVFGPLFNSLNYYMAFDSEFCASDPKYVEMLIIMGTEAMLSKGKNANEASNADGALLLHLILQKMTKALTLPQLEKIFEKCLERLTQEIKHDFLKAKILGIFLNGFIFCFNETQTYLLNRKILPEILSKTLEKIELYVHSYDRKVFINGMSALITQPELSEIISLKALQIIDSIVTMLKVQQLNEVKEKERKKNLDIEEEDDNFGRNLFNRDMDKLNQDFYEDDEDDNDEENDDEDDDFGDEDDDFDDDAIDFSKENEEYEAKSRSHTFVSDIDKVDEYNYFKEALTMLKNKDHKGLQSILGQLSGVKQEFLKQVLCSQRIVMNDDPNNKTAPRKIVKVKGKKKISPSTGGS